MNTMCVCETLFILNIVYYLQVNTNILTSRHKLSLCLQVQESSKLNFALCDSYDVFVIFESVAYNAVHSRFGRFAEVIGDVSSSFH